jgi:hypothetical protein
VEPLIHSIHFSSPGPARFAEQSPPNPLNLLAKLSRAS